MPRIITKQMYTCNMWFRLLLNTLLIVATLSGLCNAELQMVSKETFHQIVNDTKYVLVLFFYDVELCERCVEAEKEIEKVNTRPELYEEEIKIIKCEDPGTAVGFGITTVPQVVYFRDGVPALFEIPERVGKIQTEDVDEFVETAQMVATQTLHDESFEHLTQAATGATTGDWLVIFYNPTCSTFLPAIEGAGVKIRLKMNVAKVNIDENPGLKARFKIKECPTTYYFRFGKMYHYFSEEPDQYHVSSLISFVMSWYKNVKAQPVPVDPTAFDMLTEAIADYLKEQLHSPNRGKFLLIVSVVMAVVSLIISVIVVTCRRRGHTKTE